MATSIELRYDAFTIKTRLAIDEKETSLRCFGTGVKSRLADWIDDFFPELILKKCNFGPGAECSLQFYGTRSDFEDVEKAHKVFCEKNDGIKVNLSPCKPYPQSFDSLEDFLVQKKAGITAKITEKKAVIEKINTALTELEGLGADNDELRAREKELDAAKEQLESLYTEYVAKFSTEIENARIEHQILPENSGNELDVKLGNNEELTLAEKRFFLWLGDYLCENYLRTPVSCKPGNPQIISALAAGISGSTSDDGSGDDCFKGYLLLATKNEKKFLTAVNNLYNEFSRQIIPALYQKQNNDFIIHCKEKLERFTGPDINIAEPDTFSDTSNTEEVENSIEMRTKLGGFTFELIIVYKKDKRIIYRFSKGVIGMIGSGRNDNAKDFFGNFPALIEESQALFDGLAEQTKEQVKESLLKIKNFYLSELEEKHRSLGEKIAAKAYAEKAGNFAMDGITQERKEQIEKEISILEVELGCFDSVMNEIARLAQEGE
jgi:cyclophilin family peptidyl-prolyl cis-trans isomerase